VFLRDTDVTQQQYAQQAGQLVTKLPPGAPPPLPAAVKYHVVVGNQNISELELEAIKKLVVEGKVNRESLLWREGMAAWIPAFSVPELSGLFAPLKIAPPPLPPRQ
jgi:hypothetical protein